MSITKSYNKQTDTYYAYETTYEWSDEKQKKVQRKRCIGQFDPDTGEVIPNGKVGRPSLPKQRGISTKTSTPMKESHSMQPDDVGRLTARLKKIEEALSALSAEIYELRAELSSLSDRYK